jgi:hypothetical protein
LPCHGLRSVESSHRMAPGYMDRHIIIDGVGHLYSPARCAGPAAPPLSGVLGRAPEAARSVKVVPERRACVQSGVEMDRHGFSEAPPWAPATLVAAPVTAGGDLQQLPGRAGALHPPTPAAGVRGHRATLAHGTCSPAVRRCQLALGARAWRARQAWPTDLGVRVAPGVAEALVEHILPDRADLGPDGSVGQAACTGISIGPSRNAVRVLGRWQVVASWQPVRQAGGTNCQLRCHPNCTALYFESPGPHGGLARVQLHRKPALRLHRPTPAPDWVGYSGGVKSWRH